MTPEKVKAATVYEDDEDGTTVQVHLVVPESTTEADLARDDVDHLCACPTARGAEMIAEAWNAYYTRH